MITDMVDQNSFELVADALHKDLKKATKKKRS